MRSAEEAMEKRYALRAKGIDLDRIAARVSEVLDIKTEDVWAKGRYRQTVEARGLLCYWAVRELGLSMSLLAHKLGISIPAISGSVARGQKLVIEKGLELLIT